MKADPTGPTLALRKLAAAPSPALFAGPPGSGKAQAAQDLANTLGVQLRRVDLRRLASPDIAETEKALDRLFDAARRDGAVLVFDEADALFGKRSDVRDAHDRYANTEANYLLARIEAHRGPTLVIAKSREALDPAVLRRLAVVIEFPAPRHPDK
jgi:SpoVK/Ycf46/Vps4 family AAA+-type ATPase